MSLYIISASGRARQVDGQGNSGVIVKEILSSEQSSSATVVQIGEITTDSEGSIFVTDRLQYLVMKFSVDGRLTRQFGKRGKGVGDFQAGPYKIDCLNDTIAVVDLGTPHIKFFSAECSPLGEMQVAGAIVDAALYGRGMVVVSTIQPPNRSEQTIMLYTKDETAIRNIILPEPRRDPIYDMVSLCADSNGNLIVACKFLNTILAYDSQQKCTARFSVPGLPPQSMADSTNGAIASMPDEMFQDVAVDNKGNIFVLGGVYSFHPNRDVYVLDYSGYLKTVFALPHQTGILYRDKRGFFYTRESKRSVFKKYQITSSFF